MTPQQAWEAIVDRRSATRGDQRRAALLESFDELLRERTLAEVSVAEVSSRAGVTRSAFYFYFESKAAAVMALMADLYDDATQATVVLTRPEGEPRERIGAAITALFDFVDATPHTYRALLEARAVDAAVRGAWTAGRAAFAEQIASWIERERDEGRGVAGPPAPALAAVLLELNDHAVEVHATGTGPPRRDHIDVISHLWTTAIYGSDQP